MNVDRVILTFHRLYVENGLWHGDVGDFRGMRHPSAHQPHSLWSRADSSQWLQAIAIVMQSVSMDVMVRDSSYEGGTRVRFASLALYAGLIVGAAFWGTTCDVIG